MLHSGDVIMAINGQSLENCNLREAAQILMNAGEEVSLTIAKESSKYTKIMDTLGTQPFVLCREVVLFFFSFFFSEVILYAKVLSIIERTLSF